ncbi:MAG: penicillin acylase family protein [Pseudomonadota bacterium]
MGFFGSMKKRSKRVLGGGLILGFIAGCTTLEPPLTSPPEFNADIRWTSYGIPHVKADNWKGLGYGFAYATALDGYCTIAEDLTTVRGERSRYFGATPENLASDILHRAIITDEEIARRNALAPDNDRAFTEGYVRGFERYLQDHADDPVSCQGEPWRVPYEVNDLVRVQIGVGIRYGMLRFAKEIVGAAPPDTEVALEISALNAADFDRPAGLGSNAIGIGREYSHNDRGILFGNPHYPWFGASRFHMIHTTIPGEMDVMGVSLLNTNRVSIGFNKDVAWSHTVSGATRFTLYELALNPDNPLQYEYDGAYRDMRVEHVDLPNGAKAKVYFSHYGPMFEGDAFPWTDAKAYTLRDAVVDNTQASVTYDALSRARNVDEVEAAISLQGVYWTNTVAADRDGNAYYADVSGTPNIDVALLQDCKIEHPAGGEIIILDGRRSACEWREDPRSKVPGAMPAAEMPKLKTDTYVSNSNDSYWLSNVDTPLEGYSPIIGDERTPRSLRTRAGLSLIEEARDQHGKITPDHVRRMLDAHRNYGAELLLDDILAAICTEPDGLEEACRVLSDWDRTMAIDSRGGHLWTVLWVGLQHMDGLFAVPFSADDPVNTPRGINTSPETVAAVRAVLGKAVEALETKGFALDMPLGEIQYVGDGDLRLPIPGGLGWVGNFSIAIAHRTDPTVLSPVAYGNSYMQIVSWDDDGTVVPTGILTYSQSPEPTSPHFADMTAAYSRGEWLTFPFTDEQIEADPNLRRLRLSE